MIKFDVAYFLIKIFYFHFSFQLILIRSFQVMFFSQLSTFQDFIYLFFGRFYTLGSLSLLNFHISQVNLIFRYPIHSYLKVLSYFYYQNHYAFYFISDLDFQIRKWLKCFSQIKAINFIIVTLGLFAFIVKIKEFDYSDNDKEINFH